MELLKTVNMKIKLILSLFILITITGFAQTKVYLIPTLHSLHKINNNYSYDSLKSIINRINPDIIAVEIRESDISADTSYLKKNYPYEMWMMPRWFSSTKIEGFDWLGDDIEGNPIPQNYWKEISAIKKCEKALSIDSIYTASISKCDSFANARLEILKTFSLKEILESDDATLCNKYYDCYSELLSGTDYELIPQLNKKRNEKILFNINELVKKYNGKIIVIITGDDHYVYLKDKVKHISIYY
ncbi:MAG: hypothetical protein A2W99_17560 [Bacteroidetes bacterium GWF2_33_16]|nr:MAG: hypothetical protein A2X00_14700 [Bacteroidetes bacterium GWE2_32_14]OFY06844.1 MAG: hypothetical protein A2W99_17560 [Bacteroidetes bacterium GWF2_33_16]